MSSVVANSPPALTDNNHDASLGETRAGSPTNDDDSESMGATPCSPIDQSLAPIGKRDLRGIVYAQESVMSIAERVAQRLKNAVVTAT